MKNIYTAEGLMRALQLYTIARPIIEHCFDQRANYEMTRVILVNQMNTTFGAATDFIETWESITKNNFAR